jgi:hypothetical protein
MSTGEPSSPCYLVEWYRPARAGAQLDDATARIKACVASMRAGGAHVGLVAIVAVPADDVIFGVFAATSESDVAETCRKAGMTAQRVTAAIDLGGVADTAAATWARERGAE